MQFYLILKLFMVLQEINSSKSRRAFSMRFIGDDVKYIVERGGPTSPPFNGINLKSWRFNERGLVSKSF